MESPERTMEIRKNKAIRGYILRSLLKSQNLTLFCRQIASSLFGDGLIVSYDIGNYINYLEQKGYIEFTDDKIKSYNVLKDDIAVRLTPTGIDLLEGSREDPGVDV
ncbi:MAG: hypothetical protein AB1402_03085 [Bacillota bacterium]